MFSVRLLDQKPRTATLAIFMLTANEATKFDSDTLYVVVGPLPQVADVTELKCMFVTFFHFKLSPCVECRIAFFR